MAVRLPTLISALQNYNMRLERELEAEDVKGVAKAVVGEPRDLQEMNTVYTGTTLGGSI